ncbi:serine/threonine-protein kinase 31 [Biomphalaria glabrata]|nr:serine/threonine-protein kinase 31 [Biomphalaria glabrata]
MAVFETAMSAINHPKKVQTFDVYIGNLPLDADQKKIGKVFSKFGEIHGIFTNSGPDGTKFGLVKFFCETDALKAIESTNGTVFEGGNKIVVKVAGKRPGNSFKKEDAELKLDKDDIKAALMKQRNPDIVPTFEANHGQARRDTEKILVSHVETPIMLWGQKMSQENINELSCILDQLALTCPEAAKVSGKPEMEKIYGGQYSEDKCWYRCVVKQIISTEKVKVQYIDFGNTEELDPSTLVELPKSLTALPTCAMKYMLHSLWCNNIQDPTALKYLRDMVEGKEAEIFTTARLSDHTGFFADIFVNGVSVNEKMLESGFVFRKPGLDQRGLKSRIQGGPAGDGNTSNSFNVKSGPPNIRDGSRKFESDKDEITNLRWKLKNLQTEYTSLSNKAQENDLSSQIKNLQSLSTNVRKLRNQIPLEKETPLDKALTVVQSPSKITIHVAKSVPEVCRSIADYKNAQDEICKCQDKVVLKEKIEAREEFKKELVTRLSAAIEELNNVPLMERSQQVQDAVVLLNKNYDSYIKLPIQQPQKIEILLATFEEWKVKKKVEIATARFASDQIEKSVHSALDNLKSSISLNPELNEDELNQDLDSNLKNYSRALQQEISLADVDNTQDAILLASLVQIVLTELREESNCLEHLTKVLNEFTSLKKQISPWINKTPSIAELQSVRTKLKSLKSKLRHKLADKMDAEENHDTKELEEIAQDLEVIRNNIHKALKEEDLLMAELSELASAHFPELINAEADAGFNTYITYKGLVKLSHAPDQYTMTSLGNKLSGLYESQFDGEPVFIKEYFLGSANRLGKDEFLLQMSTYSNALSPHLEPINAVFFDKDYRHAYVVIKKQGDILSSVIEATPLTKQQCQSIVSCLCKALHGLHVSSFVHGQVQPDYVVLDDSGNAKLLPPDFSMTDVDRCTSKYSTSSGLEIMAPEMKPNKKSSDPAPSVDVFCLGLLTLWMHHPNISFSETRDGTVDFSTVPLDRNLSIFLMKLLHPNPLLRPTSENCLRSEYLSQAVTSQALSSFEETILSQNGSYNSSPTPISIYNCNGNDGYVYAESSSGLQMIANTQVPPPPLMETLVMVPQSSAGTFNPVLPPSLQPPSTQQQQPMKFHQQQFQQQQQYHLQQIQQRSPLQQQLDQQQSNDIADISSDPESCLHREDTSEASFEIGTFDPNAFEVVTSPHSIRSSVDLSTDIGAKELAAASVDNQGAEDDSEWVDEDET